MWYIRGLRKLSIFDQESTSVDSTVAVKKESLDFAIGSVNHLICPVSKFRREMQGSATLISMHGCVTLEFQESVPSITRAV